MPEVSGRFQGFVDERIAAITGRYNPGLRGSRLSTLIRADGQGCAVVDGGVVLNDSVNVVATDIIGSNGVIHVIDAVLLP